MGDVIDLQDYRRKVQQRGKQRKQAGPPKAEGLDAGAGGKPKKKPDSSTGKPDKTPKP